MAHAELSPAPECEKSPDRKHAPEDGLIEVAGELVLAEVCRWCGKNLGT